MKSEQLFFSNQFAVTSLCGVGSSSLLKACKEGGLVGPWRFVSGGDTMRAVAHMRQLTIEELAAFNLANPGEGIDVEVDQMLSNFSVQNYVFAEARLAHFFFPGAFKVLLVCDIEIAARRRGDDMQRAATHIQQDFEKRNQDDNIRYSALYGPGCLWAPDQFDCVIDTAVTGRGDVLKVMLQEHGNWKKGIESEGRLITSLYHHDFLQDVSGLSKGVLAPA